MRLLYRPALVRETGPPPGLRPRRAPQRRDGLAATPDAEFLVDVREVELDGPVRDPQPTRDLVVPQPRGEERADLELARRQLLLDVTVGTLRMGEDDERARLEQPPVVDLAAASQHGDHA